MKLKFFGTAAAEGVPAIFCDCPQCEYARKTGGAEIRRRASALIDDTLMIEVTPDLFSVGIECCLASVTDIIITHSHADHAALYELMYRAAPYFCLHDGKINIYGNAAVEKKLQETMLAEFPYAAPFISYTTVSAFSPFAAGGAIVTPLPAYHALSESAFVYLIEKDGKRIFWCDDTGTLPEASMKYLERKKCDLVSVDTTLAVAKPDAFEGHMGLNTVKKLRAAMIAVGAATESTPFYCTHFSHNGLRVNDAPTTLEQLRQAAAPMLIAVDSLEVNI